MNFVYLNLGFVCYLALAYLCIAPVCVLSHSTGRHCYTLNILTLTQPRQAGNYKLQAPNNKQTPNSNKRNSKRFVSIIETWPALVRPALRSGPGILEFICNLGFEFCNLIFRAKKARNCLSAMRTAQAGGYPPERRKSGRQNHSIQVYSICSAIISSSV